MRLLFWEGETRPSMIVKAIILCLLSISICIDGYTITTIAGTGISDFSGDGGEATSAELSEPSRVFINGDDVYICDSDNSHIRKIYYETAVQLFVSSNLVTATPISNDLSLITSIAGEDTSGDYSGDGSYATSADLDTPYGVTLDSTGNVYIADTYNHRIRKIKSSTGIISTIAGTGTSSYSGDGIDATSATLSYPCGIVIDSANNLYIADNSNGRIRKISMGIITTIAGSSTSGSYGGDGGAATLANLNDPCDVAIDSAGIIALNQNLYLHFILIFTRQRVHR